ncbi:MAG: leucine-rich repeat domain-containing protein [Oscillospiraceae bacterium]|nr:leucine-rich repeat domain-containing protein [Oscillospiraceae bacterium]
MSQIENIVNDLKSALTIPNSITTIEQGAFSSCTKLSSVTIPNSVKSIESSAFSGCTALKTVTIPNSVTTIGWGAFSSCENLTSITFRRTLPPLFGVRLFEDTENVNTIYVPAGSKSAYQKIGQLSKLDIIEISVKQNAGTCEECKICISGNPPEKGKILGGEPTIFDGIEILKYLVGIESYVV